LFHFIKLICLAAFVSLAGCAQADLDKFDQSLKSLNQAIGAPPVPGTQTVQAAAPMAVRGDASKSITTELVIPNDKATEEAMNAALPVVKKVISIHQCMKSSESLRLLNVYAVTGVDMSRVNGFVYVPVNMTRYHDKSQCVDVKALDQWTLQALNALRVRAVYFATDSGETFNLFYYFMKASDGSWKLSRINEF
jgi:hypothetical protein